MYSLMHRSLDITRASRPTQDLQMPPPQPKVPTDLTVHGEDAPVCFELSANREYTVCYSHF